MLCNIKVAEKNRVFAGRFESNVELSESRRGRAEKKHQIDRRNYESAKKFEEMAQENGAELPVENNFDFNLTGHEKCKRCFRTLEHLADELNNTTTRLKVTRARTSKVEKKIMNELKGMANFKETNNFYFRMKNLVACKMFRYH